MATKKAQTPQELGSVGFKHNAGYMREEWLPALQGPRGVTRYREIGDNISEVGASLSVIRLVATRAKWKFEPYSTDPEDVERAAFFDELKKDMSHSWASLIRSALTMLQYGFAPHEMVLKQRPDNRIGWAKLPLRPQSTLHHWEFSPTGEVLAMHQQNASTYAVVRIPYEKILNFRTRSDDAGPEGVSLLRHLHWDVYRYKRLCEAEAIGVERALAGLPVMGIPAECMATDPPAALVGVYDAAKRIVQNLRVDEEAGIVMPKAYRDGQPLYSLELLSASGSKLPDTSAIVGGATDFLALGHEGVGSYALGDSKVDMFEVAVEGYLDFIAEAVQEKLVPLTLRVNGWPEDRAPRLKHLPLEKPELGKLGDYISKMISVKVITPDDPLEDYARDAADLPRRDPDSPPRQLPAATNPKPDGGAPDQD